MKRFLKFIALSFAAVLLCSLGIAIHALQRARRQRLA